MTRAIVRKAPYDHDKTLPDFADRGNGPQLRRIYLAPSKSNMKSRAADKAC
jgi:hypothetical protein